MYDYLPPVHFSLAICKRQGIHFEVNSTDHLQWILPDLSIALFGFGIIISTQAMQAYIMDSFPTHGTLNKPPASL